jgi:ABC-type branched-subunit amino acid transport system ATPase component
MTQQPLPLLKLARVGKRYAGLRALNDVSLEIEPGEIVGLVGPNGAGKSTLLQLVAGSQPVSAGQICYAGAHITRLPEYRRARAGVARVFQDISNLEQWSVSDNVELGLAALRAARSAWGELRWLAGALPEARPAHPLTSQALAAVGLADSGALRVASLSHWQRRLVTFARALASQPRLLLLDEPFGGLSFRETELMIEMIRRLRQDHGQSFLVVEHNLDAVVDLSDRIVVLHLGEKIADDVPQRVLADTRVIDVYLGGA